ncbi:hypothetical protein TIFTF001_032071 [Ficus carica]|uniref:Uncharacterized protein n=1 Tax=Ficus carica TaxID=3494 RepID=A0AA88DVR9_FICCA|nr:hypothetical protein TIFTF001_032071 [Ficus carica]
MSLRHITVVAFCWSNKSPDLVKPVRFGPWFELDWAGHPNHSMAARHVVLAERKLTTYIYVVGERAMPGKSWVDFRALIIARYGPVQDEDADIPFRDPEIYHDMYLGRYLGYVADWRAYPNELMSHYCRRFQEIFVPTPMAGMIVENMIQDIMEAEFIAYMIQADELMDDIIKVPMDDTGILKPLIERGSFMFEDPFPAVPVRTRNFDELAIS